MKETTKSRPHWGPLELKVLAGHGIDIGCGPDPVRSDARRFDIENGDANRITDFVKEQFDYVYASHCLEHMDDPRATVLDWWKLVKPGGHLFIAVPDEDLYEQGVFPSQFAPQHKATFTISKRSSWSPASINVWDLARSLPNGETLSLQLQDAGYNRNLASGSRLTPGLFLRAATRFHAFMFRFMNLDEQRGFQRLLASFWPVDQTNDPFNAQAQIQLIVQKSTLH